MDNPEGRNAKPRDKFAGPSSLVIQSSCLLNLSPIVSPVLLGETIEGNAEIKLLMPIATLSCVFHSKLNS